MKILNLDFLRNKSKQENEVSKANLNTRKPFLSTKLIERNVSQSRKDIADWKWAKQFFYSKERPKSYLIQDIFDHICNDALLTSQLNNRKEQCVSAPFEMVGESDKIDDHLTNILNNIEVISDLMGHIWESEWYGSSIVEQSIIQGKLEIELILRRNIVARKGLFYPDVNLDNYIEYRKLSEYGKWILEFDSGKIGMLDKLVSNALFKRFAKSCWSELCEIYGIPPRVFKTDTRDPEMLRRAEDMMNEVGAAAWHIIDNSENFEWASQVNTKGEVYENLIKDCNNEISLLISGAIIGQDTKNGNESKEKISIKILDRLVDSDQRMIENYMNSVVLPSWMRIGLIPVTTSKFRFKAVEDTDKLWQYTQALLPYKNVDNEFLEEKFGIKLADKQENF